MNHPHLPKACKRAITLHGFNVSDGGRGTTDKLHSGLEDNRDAPISPGILELHVLHTPTDNVVGVARRLIGSRWGSMGRDGYMGDPDPRAINVSHELFGLSDTGHSGIFDTDEGIEAILSRADLLAHRINHS